MSDLSPDTICFYRTNGGLWGCRRYGGERVGFGKTPSLAWENLNVKEAWPTLMEEILAWSHQPSSWQKCGFGCNHVTCHKDDKPSEE